MNLIKNTGVNMKKISHRVNWLFFFICGRTRLSVRKTKCWTVWKLLTARATFGSYQPAKYAAVERDIVEGA